MNEYHQKISKEIIKRGKLDQDLLFERVEGDIDSVVKDNSEYIQKVFKKHGVIGIKNFGKDASLYAWIMVQHAIRWNSREYLELGKSYLKQMKENLDDLNAKNIPLLEDIILISENKPQIYGTQVRQNEKTKKLEPYPLKYPDKVDDLRKQMGLELIEDYLRSFK